MSFEVDQSLSRSTSRRTIVRTGAKLAYAAPLVAASMHLQGARASALISDGVCLPLGCHDFLGLCGTFDDGCGGFIYCGLCDL